MNKSNDPKEQDVVARSLLRGFVLELVEDQLIPNRQTLQHNQVPELICH